jgi:hypothetical protein
VAKKESHVLFFSDFGITESLIIGREKCGNA